VYYGLGASSAQYEENLSFQEILNRVEECVPSGDEPWIKIENGQIMDLDPLDYKVLEGKQKFLYSKQKLYQHFIEYKTADDVMNRLLCIWDPDKGLLDESTFKSPRKHELTLSTELDKINVADERKSLSPALSPLRSTLETAEKPVTPHSQIISPKHDEFATTTQDENLPNDMEVQGEMTTTPKKHPEAENKASGDRKGDIQKVYYFKVIMIIRPFHDSCDLISFIVFRIIWKNLYPYSRRLSL
jgi:hypothetical protein